MAFDKRILKYSGPAGKLTTRGAEYTQIWHCSVTDPLDGPITIFNYFKEHGPYLGSYYENGNETDTESFVDEIDVPEHIAGSATEYLVKINYKPILNGDGGAGSGGKSRASEFRPHRDTGIPTEEPWLWRPEVSLSYSPRIIPVYGAEYIEGYTGARSALYESGWYGMPQNSAGVVFDPPLEAERSDLVIRVKQWFLFVDTTLYNILIDKTNMVDLRFTGDLSGVTTLGNVWGIAGFFAANTLKIHNIDAQFTRSYFELNRGARERIEYFEVNTELHYRRDGWDSLVVDRGTTVQVEATKGISNATTKQTILQPVQGMDGDAINEPVLLDGNGVQLEDGADPVYLRWRIHIMENFHVTDLLRKVFETID